MSVKRIKNLVKQLNEYRHAYYNQDLKDNLMK